MKALISTRILGLIATLVFVLASISPPSEARIGGGGSSGFRGSRGFTPRNSRPYNPGPSTNRGWGGAPSNNSRTQQPPPPMTPPLSSAPRGGSFMRGLLGGVAGGFLGSMLFRGTGFGGGMGGMAGSGGIGFFEILVFAAIGFFLFRYFGNRKNSNNIIESENRFNTDRPTYIPEPPIQDEALGTEESNTQILQQHQRDFDLNQFKEDRTDEFLRIQSAWNMRDLSPVQSLIASELKVTLDADLDQLKRSRLINKLENIAVRGAELVEAWQEDRKEYATLRFRAQLLDYTINEDTQNVVSGDRNQTVKFQEEWTFVRPIQIGSGSTFWKLTAISNE